MNVGLYRSAVAMAAQQRDLDAVAANLANLGTVGFKRGVTAAHELEVQRQHGPVRGLSTFSQVDFAQGNLQRTGRQHDLAIFGEGFFAVEGPEGEAYTRDGTFHTTESGVLVTEDGFPVAWETRSGVIDPVGVPLKIDEQGNVRQGLFDLGRLRVVDFEDKQRLTKDAWGFWKAPPDLKEIPAAGRVEQYALEESNASGVEEMVVMINIQRSFEVTARVFEAIDKTYERLTRPF